MTEAPSAPGPALRSFLAAQTDALLTDPRDAAVVNRWTRAMVDAAQTDVAAVADLFASRVQALPAPRIERVVSHELGLGREELSRQLLDRLRTMTPTGEQTRLRHTIALGLREIAEAEEAAAEAIRNGWVSKQTAGVMAARRALAAYRPDLALERLQRTSGNGAALRSTRITTLRELGLHRELLALFDESEGELPPLEMMFRYDALLAVDDLAAAHELAKTVRAEQLGAMPLFNMRHNDAKLHGAAALEQLVRDNRTFEDGGGATHAVLHNYFELGLLDEMERIEAATPPNAFDWLMKLRLARLHYCRRRFDRALELLDQIRGLDDRFDVDVLRIRTLLESGRADEAIARFTPRTESLHNQVDDALHHAFLDQHRLAEAFQIASPWRQRQTVALFGARAHDGKDMGHVGRRFVITLAGPGDELIAASLYRDLQPLSDELIITCDPRLESVLSRSFPAITFLPVARHRFRDASFLAAGRPPRAANAHFESLTADAMQVAESCDQVVLSRYLQHLALERSPQEPASAYLVPDPDRVAAGAARWDDSTPRVGIIWRSESRGTMREIHYLEVEQLAPFFEVDAEFVCLQYDATDEERAALERLTGGRICFPDDLDLRNDFESGLALSAKLSAVVGVCTTSFELAAAVGVPGVLLAPDRLVGWRASDERGQDFWHQSVRLAQVEPRWDRHRLALAGAEILRDYLTR
jgi:tetratricopeptide (TPR) repeat protein